MTISVRENFLMNIICQLFSGRLFVQNCAYCIQDCMVYCYSVNNDLIIICTVALLISVTDLVGKCWSESMKFL